MEVNIVVPALTYNHPASMPAPCEFIAMFSFDGRLSFNDPKPAADTSSRHEQIPAAVAY
jgi:hypothetical protein